jgi:hypothetical protein
MNTIKLETTPHVNIILPRIELGQKITVHNPNTGEIIIFKNEPEAVNPAAEAKTKRWKPECGETYGFISAGGYWEQKTYLNQEYDNHRYDIGNCYPYTEEGKEQAIWEQVTRRKYETALWDAADWVSGDWFEASWDTDIDEIAVQRYDDCIYSALPRFASTESCRKAHKQILGDDAERYFKGRW